MNTCNDVGCPEAGAVDCDVGSWGGWTSCYLPSGTCGLGNQNRTRKEISEAQNNGEKCAKLRIIELAQTVNCIVACIIPGDCEVGPWGSWTSCSASCGRGTEERTRKNEADTGDLGAQCPLTESRHCCTTCDNMTCPKTEVVILTRKEAGNPINYFDAKTFREYEAGFASRGELWLGLKKSTNSPPMEITAFTSHSRISTTGPIG